MSDDVTRRVQKRFRDWEAEHGREPTPDEVRAILQELNAEAEAELAALVAIVEVRRNERADDDQ